MLKAIFNINYPQTRKSSGHCAGLSVGGAIDTHVLSDAKAQVLAMVRERAAREDGGGGARSQRHQPDENHQSVKAVQVESSTLSSFTEAAFFQRCAGVGWDQVRNRCISKSVFIILSFCYGGISELATPYSSSDRLLADVCFHSCGVGGLSGHTMASDWYFTCSCVEFA